MTVGSVFRAVGTKGRLVDRVVDEIQGLILSGQLQPGAQLPPERDFAEQMAVSRTIVREASHILASKGLIETMPGVGTIVRQVNQAQISEPISLLVQTQGITVDHLHTVRTMLEIEIAGLATTAATSEDTAELERIVGRMEEVAGDRDAYVEADDQFHRTLATIARNPLLIILLDSIRDVMRQVRLVATMYPDIYKLGVPDHRGILTGVQAKDVAYTRAAMRLHLEHARVIQQQAFSRQADEQTLLHNEH